MFLQGLNLVADSPASHQELRDIAMKRMASGGKGVGMMEGMRGARGGRCVEGREEDAREGWGRRRRGRRGRRRGWGRGAGGSGGRGEGGGGGARGGGGGGGGGGGSRVRSATWTSRRS